LQAFSLAVDRYSAGH